MNKILKCFIMITVVIFAVRSFETEVQAGTTYRTKTISISYQKNKKVRITPKNYKGVFEWKSSDSSIFKIDSKGNGIVKGTGTVTVTGTSTYKNKTLVMKYTLIILRTVTVESAEGFKADSGGNYIEVRWKKNKLFDGYEVQRSSSRDFAENTKSSSLKGYKSCALYGVKKGNASYIRVRGYVMVDGKKYNGPWSSIVKIKNVSGSDAVWLKIRLSLYQSRNYNNN